MSFIRWDEDETFRLCATVDNDLDHDVQELLVYLVLTPAGSHKLVSMVHLR